jgi:Uncharacterized protein conserved in bacteria (DUF2188)
MRAHYAIRREQWFWLLERKDTGQGLAFFDTQVKAIKRGEALACANRPSRLDIHHSAKQMEKRDYPFSTSATSALIVSDLRTTTDYKATGRVVQGTL